MFSRGRETSCHYSCRDAPGTNRIGSLLVWGFLSSGDRPHRIYHRPHDQAQGLFVKKEYGSDELEETVRPRDFGDLRGSPLIWIWNQFLNLLIMLFIYIILAQSWNLMGGYTGRSIWVWRFLRLRDDGDAFHLEGWLPFIWHGSGWRRAWFGSDYWPATLRLKGMYFGIGRSHCGGVPIVVGSTFQRMLRMPNEYVASYSLISRYYVAFVVAAWPSYRLPGDSF